MWRTIMTRIILILSLLFSFSSAAEVGDSILNSATISYTISGTDKNMTSNEVNNTVVATPATIEFLAVTPTGTAETLQSTTYIDSNGNLVSQPNPLLPDGSTITPPATVGVVDTAVYTEQDLVLIRVIDIDQNTDMLTQQTIEINATNPSTGDIETLILTETTPNSGVFVGYLHTTPAATQHGNGDISVKAGDHLYATYVDNGTLIEVVAEAEVLAMQFRLLASKTQSKDVAGIGEFVKYTVTIENISSITLNNVLIEDRLPNGLKYQDGSFKVDGVLAASTLSADGRTLSFIQPILSAGQKVEISYVALIGAGTIDGKAVNIAWGSSRYGGKSNIAKITLKIKEELHRSKGFILGMVRDANISCEADKTSPKGKDAVVASSAVASVEGEANKPKGCGVEGIKLYMEDGRFVVTDKEGKYHFVDVSNGTHVVQIDDESFKGRYKLASCEQNTRFAGSSRSQFVDIYQGSLARADFCLERLPGITGSAKLTMSISKKSSNEIEITLKIDKNMGLIDPEVFLSLSEGLEYVKNSSSNHIEPHLSEDMIAVKLGKSTVVTLRLKSLDGANPDKEIRGILYFDTQVSSNQKSDIAQVMFTTDNRMKGTISQITQAEDSVALNSVGGKTPIEAGDYNWTKPTKQVYMPQYSTNDVDELGKEPRVVWPPKGWIPDIPSTRVAILYPKGHSVELQLNGRKVSMLNYEGLFRSSSREVNIMHFKGVDLAEGKNTFTALIKKGDSVVKRVSRVVFVESRAPKQMQFLSKYSYLIADGKHSPIIAVKFTGPSGHPLRGGMVGSFTTDAAHEPQTMSNGKGQYTIDSEGVAYIKLKPTAIAGETQLRFKIDDKEELLSVYLKPHLREWILVGFAEGTVGYNKLNGNMQSLTAKGAKDKWYKKGRVAFFAKGRIKGDWLLTMAYDTGRKKGDRKLFDTIDKDAYYTLYQDATSQGSEAPSTKKLYLKLEKNHSSILFGDYNTKLDKTELANYTRSFTGLKADYGSNNITATGFIAKSDKLFFREEHRGDGTRGYYQLGQKPIVDASETIIIEVRDRHREEIILESKELQRYRDYDIDYDKGTIYFKEPIYSTDRNFNPRYIVIKYEVEGDGQSHYTYGGRAAIKSSDGKYEAGVSYINEETGSGDNTLYGVDAKAKLTDNLEIKAEYAKSSNGADGNKTEGEALVASIEYKDDNLSARAYYRKQDGSFGLGQLSAVLSATRKIGIDISQKISKLWSINATLYQNRKYDDNSTVNDENVFEATASFKEKLWNGSFGYRYADNTKTKATHQIITKVGRDFMDGNLYLWISHDQSLGSNEDEEFPTKTALGLDYKYDVNTTIFGKLERSDGSKGVVWSSRVGVAYEPWKDSKITYTRLYDSGKDGSRIFDSIGLTRTLLWKEKWKVKLGYEKGIESGDSSSGNKDFDAYNVSVNYTAEKYSADASLGYRDTDGEDKVNLDAGVYIKQSDAIGLAVAVGYHRSWDNDIESRDADAKFAFVYRPIERNWVALSRLDFVDKYSKTQTDETRTRKLISNTHINWQASDKWEFGLHYGLKHVVDDIDAKSYKSWTDLVGLNARYDINPKWSVGLQGAILHSYTAKNYDYSYGTFVEASPQKDTVFTFGYNAEGFEDEDFSQQNYHQEGAYLKIKIKFDQDSVKGLVKGAVK
ncbi:MAG: DUF11 domain-containing protein [Sulfurovum sp.]|nr:DUF11 domain-containing protein [Sulfurovum sp.]